MTQPVAQIRKYRPEDDKSVRFSIAKATMEPLAVANNKVYTNPITICIWLGLTSALIDYMDLWPRGDLGVLGYLRALPPLAAMAVPIMFLVDWINRPYFEEQVQEVLKFPDVNNISTYYSSAKASGFWILQYGEDIVGLIALDASPEHVQTSESATSDKSEPKSATIRHFYVDEPYRVSKIEQDLLRHAIRHGFNADPTLQSIRAPDSPLQPYIRACLASEGFQLDRHTKGVGILGWKLGMRILDRKEWEKKTM